MILEAIISVIKVVALFIINLLPAFPDMSSWVNVSLAPIMDVIFAANYFIDLSVCVNCLLTVVVFANIEFIWSVLMWIIKKIPGVN